MDPLNTDTLLIHRLSTAPSVSVLTGFYLVGQGALHLRTGTSTGARFKLKILGVFSKNIHSGKFLFLFFTPKTLVRLLILKEVTPSSHRKMIKLLTFDNLFRPLRHFR